MFDIALFRDEEDLTRPSNTQAQEENHPYRIMSFSVFSLGCMCSLLSTNVK